MSDLNQEKNKQSSPQDSVPLKKRSASADKDKNSDQKNYDQKNPDQKKAGKARFAAPLIPGGVVAALLIASLAGYEVPVYSANIEELALASDTTADEDSAITLPELTEQPDEDTTSSGDTIESISAIDESDAKYKDGTYTGTGTGWGGTITVQVVIKNGLIASVTILSAPDETPEYFTKAKSITSAIVKAQSTNVDTVSGATYSSNGIIEAVRNALAKAGGSSSSSSSGGSSSGSKGSSGSGSSSSKTKAKALATVDESSAQYADGTWTGTGEGWGGDITVKVRIKNGVIKKITVADASDETPEYFNQAKAVITYIINGQTTNVDTVSGATYSSNGIIEAVRDALSKAAAAAGNTTAGNEADTAASDAADDTTATESTDSGSSSDSDTSGDSAGTSAASGSDDDTDETVHKYLDGTYTGTGEGWGGDITVAVTISDDTITAIEITSAEDETTAFLKKATAVIDYILAAQSTDVDTVSGATYSSNGIIEAVSNALAEAEALAEAYYGSTDDNSNDEDASGSEDSSGSGDDADAGDTSGSGDDADSSDGSTSGNSETDRDDSDDSDDSDEGSGSGDDTDSGDDADSENNGNSDDSSGTDGNSDSGDSSGSGDDTDSGDDADDSDGTTSGDSETDPDDSNVNTDDDADDGYTMLNGTYSVETTVYCDEWEDFYDYQISMLVTIESDAITAIDDITGDTDTTNQAYLKLAANGNKKYTGVVAQIIAAGNADDIDVVSGATCSSNAIIAGAKQAIEEATAAKASE